MICAKKSARVEVFTRAVIPTYGAGSILKSGPAAAGISLQSGIRTGIALLPCRRSIRKSPSSVSASATPWISYSRTRSASAKNISRLRGFSEHRLLAEALHIFGIVGQVARQTLRSAGKIPSQVVTGSSTPRPPAKGRFEALTHQNGLRDSSGPRLALQFSKKVVLRWCAIPAQS